MTRLLKTDRSWLKNYRQKKRRMESDGQSMFDRMTHQLFQTKQHAHDALDSELKAE